MRKLSKHFQEPMVKDLPLITSCQMRTFVTKTFIVSKPILVRDLKRKVLLGVPFLNPIYPIRVDNQSIRATLLDKEIL